IGHLIFFSVSKKLRTIKTAAALLRTDVPSSFSHDGSLPLRESFTPCYRRRAGFWFGLRPPLFDRLQDFGNGLTARLGAEVALAVDADADGVGVQVAFPDDEHGVDFDLLGPL